MTKKITEMRVIYNYDNYVNSNSNEEIKKINSYDFNLSEAKLLEKYKKPILDMYYEDKKILCRLVKFRFYTKYDDNSCEYSKWYYIGRKLSYEQAIEYVKENEDVNEFILDKINKNSSVCLSNSGVLIEFENNYVMLDEYLLELLEKEKQEPVKVLVKCVAAKVKAKTIKK